MHHKSQQLTIAIGNCGDRRFNSHFRSSINDLLRKKLAYPDLKRAVMELDGRFAPDVILVEDRASGTQFVQELIATGCAHATRVSPQGDKVMRMHAESPTIENGFVFLPESAPWLADTLSEFLAFPKGRHDDQVELDRPGAGLSDARPRRRGRLAGVL